MNRQEAHKLVDELYDMKEAVDTDIAGDGSGGDVENPVRELPKDKRVVRTKASGDRVYLLDDVKKTRQWVTNPEVLDSLGFTLIDVGEVEEDEMLKYQMGPALYRRVDEA